MAQLQDNPPAYSDQGSAQEGKKEKWGNKAEFVLSCIGFSVGLGNVWRFPYVCYSCGGGAFLLPFCFFMLLAGIPLVYMEMGLGQFSGSGPITAWNCAPLFKGIGWCMVSISFFVATYYNVILSWCLFYLAHIFRAQLPWATCNNHFNSHLCADVFSTDCDEQEKPSVGNITFGVYCMKNSWVVMERKEITTPAEEFFSTYMLDQSPGIEDMGGISWQLVVALFVSWILVFACLWKGIRSLGKVSYFTTIFPYFLLTVLLIRGLTLPGAMDGIEFYLRPDFNKLREAKVWQEAASQVFFSFGVGWGTLIAFSSYNDFENNFARDALIVSLADGFTSIFAGFVVFAIIGFSAHSLGVPVEEAVQEGPGLAFLAYPMAASRMPIPQLWTALFFFMLLLLGLDTQFGAVEGVLTALCDKFPHTLGKRKLLTTFSFSTVWFLLGLSMCTGSGIYIFHLIDSYAAGLNLLIAGIVEVLVISWVYGTERFGKDVQVMLGNRPMKILNYLWKYCAPLALIMILVISIVLYEPVHYNSYHYPLWANAFGFTLVVVSFCCIPVCMLDELIRTKGTLQERIRMLCSPNDQWKSHESVAPPIYKLTNNETMA